MCLLLSGICDFLTARLLKLRNVLNAEKRFGIQLDSLADTVCFGVLHAAIMYHIGGFRNHVTLTVAGFYVLGLQSSAWHGSMLTRKRQDSASKCREFYTGMPVTVSAFILPIVLALANISGNSMLIPGTITLLVLAFAFIAPIKVPKLNFSIGHQKNNEQEDHSE